MLDRLERPASSAFIFSVVTLAAFAAAAQTAVVAPKAALEPGLLLGIAAAAGVLIRSVIVPFLKSPFAGSIFKKVPLPVQTLLILLLCALAAALEKVAVGGTLLDALMAALTAYAAAQGSYALTAPAFEKRR